MVFPVDKLQLIQDACEQTGDYVPQVAEDGSEEWAKGSTAYEMALPYAIEGADWKFGTKIETLTRQGGSADSDYDDAYAKPTDLLHLIWVRLNDLPLTDYKIVDNKILLTADGGVVTIKSVKAPDITAVTPTFAMAMRSFVMSGIYRGLHNDQSQADKMWAAAEGFLRQAAARSDQEQPKRAMFNSRVLQARRTRRPYR